MAKKRFWQSSWFPGLLISLLFLSLGWSGMMTSLEWQAYALGSRLSPAPEAKQNLEIITIDEASLEELGKWPWPRSLLGVMVKKLDGVGARTVGIALPLHTAQSEFGVNRLDSMRDQYDGKYEKTVKDMLFRARQRLDTDGALAANLKRADNTVLAISYGLNNERRKGATSESRLLALKSYVLENYDRPQTGWLDYFPSVLSKGLPSVTQPLAPIPMLAKHSDAGMLDESENGSGRLVSPMVFKYADQYYPAFSLVFAAKSLQVKTDDIRIDSRQNIQLGKVTLETDPGYRVYPRLYESSEDEPAFKVRSFLDVYYNRIKTEIFKGKDVLIGITAPSLVDPVTIPGGDSMMPLLINAHLINNLVHGDMLQVPAYAMSAQLIALALVALFLMLVLPRMGLVMGLVSSLLLLFIMLNVHFGMMVVAQLWLPLALPTLALVCGVIALALRSKIEEAQLRTQAHLFESNLTLGQHLQAQGQLDQAFAKYRECPIDEAMQERLYSLGLDYERRRQFNKAIMVFEHIGQSSKGFRDIKKRIKKNRQLQDMVVLKNGGATMHGALILTDDGVQKPMLGRYEIEKEIGRGAMGMVYLGRDPKIGRTVAIKTMALSEEFEADELEHVKSRFMREAETAGRLNHQNIVTIYDVGEEQELNYIAMDYLKGQDLSNFRKKDKLLPLNVVVEIGIQVADALDFAHKNDVVHRDIKPANIIYDEAEGSIKVTDFGVAFLTNSSKTKTGTMLGTPYYMSPEQASGDRVDGRADIFSLGITLYELSTGRLPFMSESLSGQVFKICNEKQIDANKVRPQVPACLSRVINKALNKKLDDRYVSGAQMAKSLRQCLKSM
ncbi:MAG: serine/threonine-protein kinase [Gammaproteobacteria bacterium]|nr:serine/threonine-protein kinase [Gammaproteobacteria bacterium]